MLWVRIEDGPPSDEDDIFMWLLIDKDTNKMTMDIGWFKLGFDIPGYKLNSRKYIYWGIKHDLA